MSLDTVRESIPDFGKDLRLNLSSLARETSLTEQQLWGSFLTAAAATRNATVLKEIAEDARAHLSPEAFDAALGAASIMGMNNVLYRARHFLHGEYDRVPAHLRMNIIGRSGDIDKVDFELFAAVASAINGCEACLAAHEHTVREAGLTQEQVFAAIRIASAVAGAAQAVEIAEALA